MKTYLAMALTFFTFSTLAAPCVAVLEDRTGYEVDRFVRYGQYACEEAQSACKMDMAQRRGQRGLSCRIERRTQPPRQNTCEFSIVRNRTQVVRSFSEYGNSACFRAEQRCQDELWQRQRRGELRDASCQNTTNDGPGRPPGTITASCTVNRISTRFGFVQRYFSSARGTNPRQVRQMACNQASRQCERDRFSDQYCQVMR